MNKVVRVRHACGQSRTEAGKPICGVSRGRTTTRWASQWSIYAPRFSLNGRHWVTGSSDLKNMRWPDLVLVEDHYGIPKGVLYRGFCHIPLKRSDYKLPARIPNSLHFTDVCLCSQFSSVYELDPTTYDSYPTMFCPPIPKQERLSEPLQLA